MLLEVTLQFDNIARFTAFASLLDKHGFSEDAAVNTGNAKPSAPRKLSTTELKAEAPKAESPKVETPKAEPVEQPKVPPIPDALKREATPSVTFDEVKNVTLKLSRDKGREVAIKVLGGFNVAKATELKPDQYAAYVADANEALAA